VPVVSAARMPEVTRARKRVLRGTGNTFLHAVSPSHSAVMTTTIAVTNQKGGVGKTTTTLSLAAYSAVAGRRTLVIDNDPQANASSVLAPNYTGPSIYRGGQPLQTGTTDLWCAPAGHDLSFRSDLSTASHQHAYWQLRELLRERQDEYDVIFIDCPPSLATLPMNALLAADGVIIPLQCEYFAMEGLGQILATLETCRADFDHAPTLLGVLMTMYDDGESFHRQVVAEVKRHLGERVFHAIVPRDIALTSAPSHNQTIIDHDPLSAGSLAYLSAAKELFHAIG
jgi:chromosome partitioning protein